jgi:hypothetical protein
MRRLTSSFQTTPPPIVTTLWRPSAPWNGSAIDSASWLKFSLKWPRRVPHEHHPTKEGMSNEPEASD